MMQFIKCYENASLTYTGIDRNNEEEHNSWDTVISDEDYYKMFSLQQASMEAPRSAAAQVPKDNKHSEPAAKAPMPKTVPAKQKQLPTISKPTVKSIDISCIQTGSILQHKTFSLGTVTILADKRITVAFEIGEKIFVFPNAILSGFLSIPELKNP